MTEHPKTESRIDWTMMALRTGLVAGLVLVVLVLTNSTGSTAGAVLLTVLVCAGVYVYFMPAIAAYSRSHLDRKAILILNVTAGWLLIPWVVALVWAYKNDGRTVAAAEDHAADQEETKRCPFCAETILAAAIRCKHCKSDLT